MDSFFHLDHHHHHNQIPFLIAYIERRQAEIDPIVTLSAKFQMNWRMDQMLRLIRWLFIILAPNKGGSVEEIIMHQRFELLYIERKQAEIDLIVALAAKIFQSMKFWINRSIRLEKVKCIIQPLHIIWRGFY